MRKTDIYEFEREGEIVVPLPKLAPGQFADDEEGNARCLFGVQTDGRTTTAMVRDIPISEETLITYIEFWLRWRQPDVEIKYRKLAQVSWDIVRIGVLSIPFGRVVECRDLRIATRALVARMVNS